MVPLFKPLKVLNPLFFGARYKGLRLFICQEQYGISSHPNQRMEIFDCGPRPKGRGRKKGGGGREITGCLTATFTYVAFTETTIFEGESLTKKIYRHVQIMVI